MSNRSESSLYPSRTFLQTQRWNNGVCMLRIAAVAAKQIAVELRKTQQQWQRHRII